MTAVCFGFLLRDRGGFRVRVKFRVRAEFRVRVGLRVWVGFRVRVLQRNKGHRSDYGRTDRPTDIVTYRVACTRLKVEK